MRIDAGHQLRMEQSLKLSPRMIQTMEILQLPALALEERIEQELEQNPVLELHESLGEHPAGDPDDAESRRPLVVGDSQADGSAREFRRASEMHEKYGDSWTQNTQESAEYRPTNRDNGGRDAKMDAMANTASRGPGLAEQIHEQWRYLDLDPVTRAAGEHLIQYIDSDGYLRTDMRQLLAASPQLTREQLEATLHVLQRHIDPPGIGARNLRECLLIQLDALSREQGESDELSTARVLVRDHIDDIEANKLPQAASRSGLSMERIKAALALLKRLDPRPARQLAQDRPQVVVPDVVVEYDTVNDRYVAALTRGNHRPLRINPTYRLLAKDRSQVKETRQYLAHRVSSARWLIDAIEHRKTTLLRVVNVILEEQREFLDHGPQHLKPLPMVQVAQRLNLHVATVSRAVAEKTIQTPRGVYALRMFFSGGTESADGQEMSWSAVQARLKDIIESENPSEPLSDDKLVERLKESGIEIARRTVAKYRTQLNIPTASRRKKY